MDLDLLSGGRAVLGLGSSAQSLTEGAFGMPYGKPLRHMREVIGHVRAIVAGAHTGTLGVLSGEYHTHDLRQFRTFAPPVRTAIPIAMPAVFQNACVLAGEIADGLLGHPLWNTQWIDTEAMPALVRGLAIGARDRTAVEVNLQMWIAVNDDRRAAIDESRATVAYYSQSPQYLRYFDAIGFGAPARALQQAFARGDMHAMVAACPDAMVESIAIVGSAAEVRERVDERCASADAFTPVAPHIGLPAHRIAFYSQAIAALFY